MRRASRWRWKARSRARESKRQREADDGNEKKLEAAPGDLLGVDHHEFKVQEHDKKFLDLESAVAELKSRPYLIRSQLGHVDANQRFDVLGRTARGFPVLRLRG